MPWFDCSSGLKAFVRHRFGQPKYEGDGFDRPEPSAPAFVTDEFLLTKPCGETSTLRLYSDKKVSVLGLAPTYNWCHGRSNTYWIEWHHSGMAPSAEIRPKWKKYKPVGHGFFVDVSSQTGWGCMLLRKPLATSSMTASVALTEPVEREHKSTPSVNPMK